MTQGPGAGVDVEVNGRTVRVAAPATLDGLVRALGLTAERIAIEHRGTIVRRTAWGETALAAGDRVEIFEFVGGG